MKTKSEIRAKKAMLKEKLRIRNLNKKVKKQFSRSKLVEEADRIFSIYIRWRDTWKPCCTCGTAWTENAQCWHFMSRRHYHTRWSADNAHWQCYRCNMLLSWEQWKHASFINRTYWPDRADLISIFASWTAKIEDSEILETIQHYYKKCFEMWLDYKPKKQYILSQEAHATN